MLGSFREVLHEGRTVICHTYWRMGETLLSKGVQILIYLDHRFPPDYTRQLGWHHHDIELLAYGSLRYVHFHTDLFHGLVPLTPRCLAGYHAAAISKVGHRWLYVACGVELKVSGGLGHFFTMFWGLQVSITQQNIYASHSVLLLWDRRWIAPSNRSFFLHMLIFLQMHF